jgi:pSer/pThr/pTyr-binding forkhead associated (FHA) protein
MTAKLEILSGSLEGRTYPVDEDEFVIGRSRGCDIVIPKRYVSRQHARICRDGTDFIVDGLSEKNPVRIGDRAITEYLLSDGDVFEFCGIRIRFRHGTAPSKRRGGKPRQSKPAPRQSKPAPRSDPEPQASWRDDDDDDDSAEDSWRSEPAAAPIPKDNADSWADEAEDSWRSDAPAGLDPDEDSWGEPAKGDWDDEESEDESSYDESLKRRASRRGSGSDRVVFGADDADDDSEGTGELPLDKLAHLSSRGSGSGVGAGESSNERTAELDAGPKDLDDPDYDPFAEVEATRKKGREADPQREKALKALSILGLLGIALAGGIYHNSTKIEPWKAPIPANDQTRIHVAVGQTLRFEEPWASADPPQGAGFTPPNGSANVIHKDAVAQVEWAVPHLRGRAIWLVTGLETGTTELALRYPRSRRIKMFEVVVDGDDPHELGRDKRRSELKEKPQRTLLTTMKRAMDSGDTFRSRRDAEGKESYYRQAMLEYGKASDAAQALRKKGYALPENELRRVEDAEQKAREEYEAFGEREFATFRDLVARGDSPANRIEQLKRVLRGISHVCEPRYMRLSLILRESYNGRLQTTGAEQCEHYQQ